MNYVLASNLLVLVQKHSPHAYLTDEKELIVEPKRNVYLRLGDIETQLQLQCKVIEWLTRPSCSALSFYWQKRIRAIANEILGTNFSKEEMETIYAALGNRIKPEKTLQFIASGYDLETLRT